MCDLPSKVVFVMNLLNVSGMDYFSLTLWCWNWTFK